MCIYTLAHLKVLKKMLAPKSYSNLNRHLVTSYPLPISFLGKGSLSPILKCPLNLKMKWHTWATTFFPNNLQSCLLLHLVAVGDRSVKSNDLFSFLHITLPQGHILWPWFQGSIATSLQRLHFWEMIVLEMKRHTSVLTPQMPWSRGRGSYNPPPGPQWRETFRPRGSTSRSTFYQHGGGSPAEAARARPPASPRLPRTEGRPRPRASWVRSEEQARSGSIRERAAGPPPEVPPGRHRKGLGEGRCHTERRPGYSRLWLVLYRLRGENRPLKSLRFPGSLSHRRAPAACGRGRAAPAASRPRCVGPAGPPRALPRPMPGGASVSRG